MKTETALSSETTETIYKTKWRQNPEDKYLNINSREKVKSYKCNEVYKAHNRPVGEKVNLSLSFSL